MLKPTKTVSLLLISACVLVVVLFYDSVSSMIDLWSLSSYQHGYFIPPLAIFFFYKRREFFQKITIEGSWLGFIFLVAAVFTWYLARYTSVQGLEHLSLISMMVIFLWTIAGNTLIKYFWFPMLFLFLCLPAGESIIPTLQKTTADLTSMALSLTSVPAFREGMIIHLPGGSFEVAKACSGMRYLTSGVVLAILFADLMIRRVSIKIFYVAIIAVVFVFMNGLRAYLTMLIASKTHMKYMVGEDHIWLGYVLFIIVLYLMYWTASRIDQRETHAS